MDDHCLIGHIEVSTNDRRKCQSPQQEDARVTLLSCVSDQLQQYSDGSGCKTVLEFNLGHEERE